MAASNSMIKNNIFFLAAAGNAAVIVFVSFLISESSELSTYLEFLLLLQLLSFCDLGLLAFVQRFSARIFGGVSEFEDYGYAPFETESCSTVCRDLTNKFFKAICALLLISVLNSIVFVYALTYIGFFKALQDENLAIFIAIGVISQTILVTSNFLIGFDRVVLAKSLEILLSFSRICSFGLLFYGGGLLSMAYIGYVYAATGIVFAFVGGMLVMYVLRQTEFDQRLGGLKLTSSVLPFLLRYWPMSFLGFAFFNFTALFSTFLGPSLEKNFILVCSRFMNFARIYAQSELMSGVPHMIRLNLKNNRDELFCYFDKKLFSTIKRFILGFMSISVFIFFYVDRLNVEFSFILIATLLLLYFHEVIQSSFAQLVLLSNNVPFFIPSLLSVSAAYGVAFAVELQTIGEVLGLQYAIFLSVIGWFSMFLSKDYFHWKFSK